MTSPAEQSGPAVLGAADQPPLLISLVQSLNGTYAADGWTTAISNDEDFGYFRELRRAAGAVIVDRRTALNPQLPRINAPGKALERTPVHVLSRTDPARLQAELDRAGLGYHAHGIGGAEGRERERIRAVIPALARKDREAPLLCEAGPHLAYRLLAAYPGAELHLSISPLYLHGPGTHASGLQARIPLHLTGTERRGDQMILRYRAR